jgi:uracil-DNA glycosylase
MDGYDFPPAWRALLDANASQHLEQAMKMATGGATSKGNLVDDKRVFPPRAQWFAALRHTAPENVRAVIVGQDPYPTLGNAMGLAFSVPRGVAVPASLRNIYKAMQQDLGLTAAAHGDLTSWAKQGVLLLNSVLTVFEGAPNSHIDYGWQQVTDSLIAALGTANSSPKAFLLWGAHAQKKVPMIAASKHEILLAAHPSPLSAYRGFYECAHFSKTNAFLKSQGLLEIDWALPA